MSEHDKRILELLPMPELLCQMAEEAAELSKAALKLRRAMDGTNPTPMTVAEARKNLIEEIADVRACENLMLTAKDCMELHRIQLKKKERGVGRLEAGRTDKEEPADHLKHGKWTMLAGDYCVCSECNKTSTQTYYFCPECGAKMDGEHREDREAIRTAIRDVECGDRAPGTAAPVKRGWWIRDGYLAENPDINYWICSECGIVCFSKEAPCKCDNCGAVMSEE